MATVTSSKRHLLITSDTYTSNGDVTVGGDLQIYHNGNNAAKKFETTSAGVTVTGTGVFTGNVGIGTTSPSSKLHVRASNSGASAVADGTLIVEQGSAPSIQILSANTQTQSLKFGDPL